MDFPDRKGKPEMPQKRGTTGYRQTNELLYNNQSRNLNLVDKVKRKIPND